MSGQSVGCRGTCDVERAGMRRRRSEARPGCSYDQCEIDAPYDDCAMVSEHRIGACASVCVCVCMYMFECVHVCGRSDRETDPTASQTIDDP